MGMEKYALGLEKGLEKVLNFIIGSLFNCTFIYFLGAVIERISPTHI